MRMMTEWNKYRNKLEDMLADIICKNVDDMIDFLHNRDKLEYEVAVKISCIPDDDFPEVWDRYTEIWNRYIGWKEIEHAIAEIEMGDRPARMFRDLTDGE